MRTRFIATSIAGALVWAGLCGSASATDDWAYWDEQCAPKCATAGPDGRPDGGCLEHLPGESTLAHRQANPAAHVYNAKLAKLLVEKKAISATPVKPTAR